MSETIITLKDVQHVAKLARIALTPDELATYQGQLERILGHIARLKEKDTNNVPPMSHPYEASNVWREDEAKPFPNLKALFQNAPEMEEAFYKVKKVIE